MKWQSIENQFNLEHNNDVSVKLLHQCYDPEQQQGLRGYNLGIETTYLFTTTCYYLLLNEQEKQWRGTVLKAIANNYFL